MSGREQPPDPEAKPRRLDQETVTQAKQRARHVTEERERRRAQVRERQRVFRRRLAAGLVLVAVLLIGVIAGVTISRSDSSAASQTPPSLPRTSSPATHQATTTAPTSSVPTTQVTSQRLTQTPTTKTTTTPVAASKPPITLDLIPLTTTRLAETATYAKRHYGFRSYFDRDPKVIVLHFTASSSYAGVHAEFSNDTPNTGELPGVCSQFVVDQNGKIYQQVPLGIMCRHTIGLNDRSVGIEMVQVTGPSAHWADQQILHRHAQINRVLQLVRWLQAKYHVSKQNVIGHAMANDSPYFHDLEGWKNDHSDWQPEDVRQLREML